MRTESLSSLAEGVEGLRAEMVARQRMLTLETSRCESLRAMVQTNRADIADFEAAIALCRTCTDQQAAARSHVEGITTALLNGVMQGIHGRWEGAGPMPEYRFTLEPKEDENGAIVGLVPTVTKNGVPDDPRTFGGGVQNLLSFAVRLIHVLLNPELAQVLMLDEPLTNVSFKAWQFVVRFLEDLQADLGLQVLVVTHVPVEFPRTYRVFRQGQTSSAELCE